MDNLRTFQKQGYIHLKNVIPESLLANTRYLAISLAKQYRPFEGQSRENGSGVFWKGLEKRNKLSGALHSIGKAKAEKVNGTIQCQINTDTLATTHRAVL